MTTPRDASTRLNVHTILSLMVLTIGLVLLVYMIRVESEPGALPLLLVAIGAVWYISTRARRRSSRD